MSNSILQLLRQISGENTDRVKIAAAERLYNLLEHFDQPIGADTMQEAANLLSSLVGATTDVAGWTLDALSQFPFEKVSGKTLGLGIGRSDKTTLPFWCQIGLAANEQGRLDQTKLILSALAELPSHQLSWSMEAIQLARNLSDELGAVAFAIIGTTSSDSDIVSASFDMLELQTPIPKAKWLIVARLLEARYLNDVRRDSIERDDDEKDEDQDDDENEDDDEDSVAGLNEAYGRLCRMLATIDVKFVTQIIASGSPAATLELATLCSNDRHVRSLPGKLAASPIGGRLMEKICTISVDSKLTEHERIAAWDCLHGSDASGAHLPTHTKQIARGIALLTTDGVSTRELESCAYYLWNAAEHFEFAGTSVDLLFEAFRVHAARNTAGADADLARSIAGTIVAACRKNNRLLKKHPELSKSVLLMAAPHYRGPTSAATLFVELFPVSDWDAFFVGLCRRRWELANERHSDTSIVLAVSRAIKDMLMQYQPIWRSALKQTPWEPAAGLLQYLKDDDNLLEDQALVEQIRQLALATDTDVTLKELAISLV